MFSLDDKKLLQIEGPHRFVTIAGITGVQLSGLKTKAFIKSSLLNSENGTISFWASPTEDIDKSPNVNGQFIYPFLSDHFPAQNVDSSHFSVYYQGSGYPRVISRFTDGGFWAQMDYGVAPFVYAESLPLMKGQWYHFAVTWNKAAESLVMYVNGEMVGHNYSAKAFKKAGTGLFIGNPLMVISRIEILDRIESATDIRKKYLSLRPSSNDPADKKIKSLVIPEFQPQRETPLDNSWKKTYQCMFTDQKDLKEWTFQTGDQFKQQFTFEIDSSGLMWKTPGVIHTESRGYLWSPVIAEGDQCIEFEFQVLSPKGLALVIMCASGMLGEDIITDQGLRKTGSMADMNNNYRNYHWEFVRRVEAMRTDVETQYVNKNPWGKSLFVGCVPRLPQNRWIKLRMMKTGNDIKGWLDGKLVYSVTDNPYSNNGPALNSGRVVLRQMYNTAMKYRNFVIYERKKKSLPQKR